MKHIKKFNESIRDDVSDQISSSFTASGSLVKYEKEIKNDILSYIDGLLDEEIDTIHQIAQLQKGEIQLTDVDLPKLMEMGQNLNKHLMDILRKYKGNR